MYIIHWVKGDKEHICFYSAKCLSVDELAETMDCITKSRKRHQNNGAVARLCCPLQKLCDRKLDIEAWLQRKVGSYILGYLERVSLI